jgi:hypothetical protein
MEPNRHAPGEHSRATTTNILGEEQPDTPGVCRSRPFIGARGKGVEKRNSPFVIGKSSKRRLTTMLGCDDALVVAP